MQAFFTNFNFWKFLLLLFVVAIAAEVLQTLLGIAAFAVAAYLIYRGVRWLATSKERKIAATQATIARLEAENARLEKLLHTA